MAATGLLVATVGCSSDGGDGDGAGKATTTVAFTGTATLSAADVKDADRCDPIAGGCLLPFPNDHFTRADRSTPTGRRVALDRASMPANVTGVHVDPTHWNELDGFSPAAAAIVAVPNLDLAKTKAAPVTDLGASLDRDAPVVLLDATTGRRLAYWTELDAAAAETDEVPTLFIRPAALLPEGHRIVVGLRALVDHDGTGLPTTAVFEAYRDRLRTDDATIEARRPAMERTFADLTKAGVDRADLDLAWDFTVASTEALSGRLLHLRDDAFARIDKEPSRFTVLTDEPGRDPGIARELTGTYEVPSYLDGDGGPGSQFTLDRSGRPTHTGTYTANFDCIIPASATGADPAVTGLYGHGLLGDATQVHAASTQAVAGNRVFCATDLIGMSEGDIANAARIVGDFSTFNTLADRLQQGHLNTLVLGRLLISPDGFASDPAFQDAGRPIIGPDGLIYYGISQGGIMGAATTAIAQDWTRAVLDVPAANYGLLLDRSVDFDDFRAVMVPAYPSPADRVLALQLVQMLWDRGEASGYLQHLTAAPYPDTPTHQVLIHAAFGDHQVANVATEVEARTIGAHVVRPLVADGRTPDIEPWWEIPTVDTFPAKGSVAVLWDSGSPTPPIGNVPPRDGDDPHGDPRSTPAANRQITEFLARGHVIDVCDGRPCRAVPD